MFRNGGKFQTLLTCIVTMRCLRIGFCWSSDQLTTGNTPFYILCAPLTHISGSRNWERCVMTLFDAPSTQNDGNCVEERNVYWPLHKNSYFQWKILDLDRNIFRRGLKYFLAGFAAIFMILRPIFSIFWTTFTFYDALYIFLAKKVGLFYTFLLPIYLLLAFSLLLFQPIFRDSSFNF